jgi:uncharacterized protein
MKASLLVAFSLLVCVLPLAAQNNATPPAKSDSQPAATTAVTAPASKIDPAKAADIQRLMEVAGTRDMLNQIWGSMQTTIRPTLEQSLPPGPYRAKLIDLFFDRLKSKLDAQQFVDLAAAAYDKYLSDDDIKALTAFYQTPLGKKTLTVLPQMMSELQQQGFRIGEQAGREAMTEVLAEHPDLARSMQDAAALQH